MKRRIVQAVLLLLSIAVAAIASQGGSSVRLRQDGDLVKLEASADFLKGIPEGKLLRLTLSHRELGTTSVVGVARRSFANGLSLATRERLAFLPEAGTEIVFSDVNADPSGCLMPEFGIDCFGSFCAGTTYCLPGPGPGGFQCSCV